MSGIARWPNTKNGGAVAAIRPASSPARRPQSRVPIASTAPTAASADSTEGSAALSSLTRPAGSDTSAIVQKYSCDLLR